jgi:hypothetical protein
VTITPDTISGKPVATIFTPANATIGDLNELQTRLFGEFLEKNGKKFGLKSCDGCRSGLDKIIFGDELINPAFKGIGGKIRY